MATTRYAQPQLQLPMDEEYMDALEEVAKSWNQSRRQYWAEYLRKVCDNIPGLMDTIKARRSGTSSYNVPAPKGEMREKQPMFNEPIKEVKGYRFRYLDESRGYLDGYGTGPKDALFNSTGRRWTNDEYYETFMPTPDFIPS